MKRAKTRFVRPTPDSPVFVAFFHSQITAADLLPPADAAVTGKLFDGELVEIPGIRFIETQRHSKGGENHG